MNDSLLALLAATLEDARLQDEERRDLAEALRAASPTPETLNAVRNHAFALARERAGRADAATLLRWQMEVPDSHHHPFQPVDLADLMATRLPYGLEDDLLERCERHASALREEKGRRPMTRAPKNRA